MTTSLIIVLIGWPTFHDASCSGTSFPVDLTCLSHASDTTQVPPTGVFHSVGTMLSRNSTFFPLPESITVKSFSGSLQISTARHSAWLDPCSLQARRLLLAYFPAWYMSSRSEAKCVHHQCQDHLSSSCTYIHTGVMLFILDAQYL
ncbi:hypothetical protein B0H11DRAFT_1962872 [Mycena galericulata]|nr:hypothetical protein B0H11DRAFT_1962872 [Mycena galericulata]